MAAEIHSIAVECQHLQLWLHLSAGSIDSTSRLLSSPLPPSSFGLGQALGPVSTISSRTSSIGQSTQNLREPRFGVQVLYRQNARHLFTGEGHARIGNPPSGCLFGTSEDFTLYTTVRTCRQDPQSSRGYCQGLSRCHIDPELGYLAEEVCVHPLGRGQGEEERPGGLAPEPNIV